MPKKYMVELAQDERDELEAVLKSGTRRAVSATKLQRARIPAGHGSERGVLGPGRPDGRAGGGCAVGVTERTCQHVRRRAVVEQGPMVWLWSAGLGRCLRCRRKLDGEKEARVWCRWWPVRFRRKAAFGVRWTVKMLAEELVRLEVVESICEETVRRALKKTN